MGTATKVMLGVVGGGLLLMGGCAAVGVAAIGGTAAVIDEVDKEMKASEAQANADVVIDKCGVPGALGDISSALTITNSGDSNASYLVTIAYDDTSGVRLGEGMATVSSLSAGQSTVQEAPLLAFDVKGDGGFVCSVANVSRITLGQ